MVLPINASSARNGSADNALRNHRITHRLFSTESDLSRELLASFRTIVINRFESSSKLFSDDCKRTSILLHRPRQTRQHMFRAKLKRPKEFSEPINIYKRFMESGDKPVGCTCIAAKRFSPINTPLSAQRR